MTKWEYRTIKIEGNFFKGGAIPMDKAFNEVGVQGWELVSVIGLYAGGSVQAGVQAVFKRPMVS